MNAPRTPQRPTLRRKAPLARATAGASYAEYLIVVVAVVIGGLAGWQYLGRALHDKTRQATVALSKLQPAAAEGRGINGSGGSRAFGDGRGSREGEGADQGDDGLSGGVSDAVRSLVETAGDAVDAGADIVTGAGEAVADGVGGCLANRRSCGDGIVSTLAEYGQFSARLSDALMWFAPPGMNAWIYDGMAHWGDQLWTAVNHPEQAWTGLQHAWNHKGQTLASAKQGLLEWTGEYPRQAEESLRFTKAFYLGAGDQAIKTVQGLAQVILHPVQTVKGVAYMAANWRETGAMIHGGLEGMHDTVMTGRVEEQGNLAGRATFEVGLTAVGVGAVTKARWASRAAAVRRGGRAVASIRSAGDVVRIARAGSGSVRVWAAGKKAAAVNTGRRVRGQAGRVREAAGAGKRALRAGRARFAADARRTRSVIGTRSWDQGVHRADLALRKKLGQGAESTAYATTYRGQDAVFLARHNLKELPDLNAKRSHRLAQMTPEEGTKILRKRGYGTIESNVARLVRDVDYMDGMKGIRYQGRPIAPEIFSIVRNSDDVPVGYLVERIAGQDYHDLTRVRNVDLSKAQRQAIGAQKQKQLEILERHGKPHGDPNPRNIMVDFARDGTPIVRLIDF